MNVALWALMTALMLGGHARASTNLDQPIEPIRPTIRTEIFRGKEALNICRDVTFDCVYAIQNRNVQQNTASDAFNAGLFFSAWLLSALREMAVKNVTGNSAASSDAMRFFRKMKEYQGNLRIDDQALCEATRVVCKSVLPDMAEWESKLKTQ